MCLFFMSLTTKAQDIVWDFATDMQGWHDLGAGRDVTASWEDGSLKMTYFENSPGQGPQLWFAAVQVEKVFDASTHRYLEIFYRTFNWPTSSPQKFLVEMINSNNKPVYAYADLDPKKNAVSIDIAKLDPNWGETYTGTMKTVYLEIPHNGAAAANPATSWFGALTVIDKIELTNTQTVENPLDTSMIFQLHFERCYRADMRVAAKKAGVDADPFKPIFHIMPEAGAAGDPNGPIYANGKYHMFFQHAPEFVRNLPLDQWEEGGTANGLPYSGTGWGHVSSVDLVHWEHEPIALMPERGSYDPNFCASGTTVIDDEGIPTIFYTAAEPQTQCIARSKDPNLRAWKKETTNPILRAPAYPGYSRGGFRDPFVWREGTTWQMITCAGITDTISRGAAMHFHSENLMDWEFMGPFALGNESHCTAWECPNFLTFNEGKTGVLIVSPLYDNLELTDHNPRNNVLYSIAPYAGSGNFKVGDFKRLDVGHPNDFYATTSMKTPDGRWLNWGMNIGGSTQGDWSTHLSLPRVLSVRPDGLLSQEPIVEMEALRRNHWGAVDIALNGNYVLAPTSATCEVIAEIELGTAKKVGLDLRGSSDFRTSSRIYFDVDQKKLHFGNYDVEFELLEGENVLRIHAFVDRGIIETFVNKREVGTLRPLYNINYQSLRLFSEGGTARVRTVDVWEIGSIWEATLPLGENSSEDKAGSFSIYPNPASKSFNVSGTDIDQISIFNTSGVLVKKITKTARNISVKGLGKGLYIVKIESKGVSTTKKLIIE